jgi:hypothetical protein
LLLLVVLGSPLFAATGCNGTLPSGAVPIPDLHPVSGRVTVQGKSAEGVRVRFVGKSPLPNGGGRVLQVDAFTTPDGSFRADAYPDRTGLPAGEYVVLLSWPVTPLEDDPGNEVDQLKGRYSQRTKPSFAVEVKPGDNKLPTFELK